MGKEKIAEKNNNAEKYVSVQFSEALYLVFWGLMLFAKGIGLYDGQTLYKIFLVAAFLCIAAKMCITEYSLKEWGVIMILIVWSAVVYRVSGEKGVLICVVTVAAMKNVSVKRAFQVGLGVWTVAMGGRFLLSLMFLDNVETAVQTKNITGAVLRYFMGYPHPNVLHISYLVFTALVIYCVKETYNWKHFLGLTAGNLFLFLYSFSFTGAGIVMLFLALSLFVSKRNITKTEYFMVKMLFPFCILFSIVFPLVLRGKAFELADKVFNNRIHFARHFLTVDNLSLLGNNLAEITTNIITMDNSYVFAMVIYGLPVFSLMCAGYLCTVSAYTRQKRNMELAMICCFLIAGITEPFLFNTSFKNLSLLFLGEQLFESLEKQRASGFDRHPYALLKNQDKRILIETGKVQKIKVQLQKLWKSGKGVIMSCAGAVAVISCMVALFLCEVSPAAVEVQRDHLLAFERVRIITTVFLFGLLLGGIVAVLCCWVLGRRMRDREIDAVLRSYITRRASERKLAVEISILGVFFLIIALVFFQGYRTRMKQQEEAAAKRYEVVENVIAQCLPGVVCWGGSLTAGAGGGGTTYPLVLQELIKENIVDPFNAENDFEMNRGLFKKYDYDLGIVPVVNMGVGGEDTKTILGRNGAVPFTVKENFIIPANTEPVEIKIEGGVPLRQGNAGMDSVEIAGIPGVIAIEQESYSAVEYTYRFYRSEPGTAIEVEKGTEIITSGSGRYLDYLIIVFMGENGGYTDVSELIEQQKAIVNHQRENSQSFIIVGSHTGTEEEKVEIESALEKEYGEKYINLRTYMSSQGITDVKKILGVDIALTEKDKEMMGHGMTPESLLSDTVHFNQYGYELIGHLLYERMDKLGYFDEVREAIGSVGGTDHENYAK